MVKRVETLSYFLERNDIRNVPSCGDVGVSKLGSFSIPTIKKMLTQTAAD